MPLSISPSPTILLPNLPAKTFVGIDLITFSSTPNFHGIRDLPEGWHFLYTGATESSSLRSGGWFHVGEFDAGAWLNGGFDRALLAHRSPQVPDTTVFIWKWNAETETLVPLKGDDDTERQEIMRRKANLGAVFQSGGLFRYRSRMASQSRAEGGGAERGDGGDDEGRREWRMLTDRISPSLLSRILGSPEVDADGRPRWTVTSASTASRDADNIPGLSRTGHGCGGDGDDDTESANKHPWEQEMELSFLPVNLQRTWREGAIGRERTEAAQDRSWALGDLIHRFSGTTAELAKGDDRLGETQILGELQFTFLMVLTMMNYSCLQQWKRLLNLILTCRNAIRARESFMADAIRLLLRQMKRCDDVEGGLFDMDGDEGGEFLRKLLTKFKLHVDDVIGETDSMVKNELEDLENWVKNEYNWELRREAIVRRGMVRLEDGEEVELEINDGDEDDETGEYAPVVVDLGRNYTESEDMDMIDT